MAALNGNSKNPKKPELLAPAGSPEALERAIMAGADAVYLGLSKFNAREKAENFNENNLNTYVRRCALFGARVYVALNTLIKPDETDEAVKLAAAAREAGAAALIVQDLRFAAAVQKQLPGFPLHASTQAGVHNVYGAEAARKMGFSRIILSRETLIEDIREITSKVEIETEAFVQGALCVAFSGNCYYSGLTAGASGNRGKCLQLCRKRYTMAAANGKTESGYFLSAKDLCALPDLKAYMDAGINCFKIEGRLRRPEYAGGTVAVYRNAIDNGGNFSESDLTELKTLFNRGDYISGYPANQPKEKESPVIYNKTQSNIGVYLGKVISVSGGVARLDNPVSAGDGIKFLRSGRETGGALASRNAYETTFTGDVKPGDEARLTTSAVQLNRISSVRRAIPVSFSGEILPDRIRVTASANGQEYTAEGSAKAARTAALTSEDIEKQFARLGGTDFVMDGCQIQTSGAFLAKSELNALRGSLIDGLKEKIINETLSICSTMFNIVPVNCATVPDATQHIVCNTSNIIRYIRSLSNYKFAAPINKPVCIFASAEGLFASAGAKSAALIYSPQEYSLSGFSEFVKAADGAAVFLNLPIAARGKDLAVLKQILAHDKCTHVVVNNIYGLELAINKTVLLGFGMNLYGGFYEGQEYFAAIEKDAGFTRNETVYSYGSFPLMTLCHCPKLSNGFNDCAACKSEITYADDRKHIMPLRKKKIFYCYHELLSGKLINKSGKSAFRRCYDFTRLSAGEAEKIFNTLL